MLSALTSLMVMGVFVLSIGLFIPKAVTFWRLWKETGKMDFLSRSIAMAVVAFFCLSADFLIFIRAVVR
jgi:hypothetical protein